MLSSELHKNVGLVALCAILLAGFASTAAGSQEQTQDVTKVAVLGERTNEYSGGREILAGKIVLGRNWLENTAASSVSEALRRESSVSVGSGGRISLKGLSGYTQILLDGQPQTGGKDPMLLDPALIERIEIIHSASADSGAFSIAGTINIVTRNLRKELPTQITFSGGGNALNNDEELSYQGGWRDSSGTTFNFTGQASHLRSLQNGDAIWNWTHADGRRGENKEITGDRTRDRNLSLSPSLSFKPSPADHVQLKGSIYIYRTAYGNDSRRTSDSTFSNGDLRPRSSKYSDEHDGGSLSLRGLWNHKLTHGGQSNVSIDFTQEKGKQKFDTESYWSPSLDNSMLATENSKKNFLNGRWQLTEPNRNGHKLQYALSAKLFSKQNDRSSLFDGVASSGDWSGKLHEKFNAIDIAAWVQDDWNVSEALDVKLGWRFERRSLRVNTAPFTTNTTNSVAAPSINLSWKLDPESEQTFTFGLARTFSTLGPEMLNPRPEIRDSSLCSTNNLCGVNNPRIPDRAGNPLLSYEKSWGLDLALENQWKDASQWSLRAYHRWIDHTLAWTTELETVPWANTARWVMRPRNLGRAKAVGLTASIDTNLSDWMEDAPDLDINTSVQWNHSNISTVPGPDNRIEKQQPWSWRLGLTYKSESRPLELQADILLNPGQWWQASPDRRIYTSIQREASIKAIWTFSPKHKLILSLRNLKPVTNRSFTQLAGNPSIQLLTAQRARTGLFLRWESKFE